MNDSDMSWVALLEDQSVGALTSIINTLPSLLAAAIIFIAGWLIATVLRGFVRRLSNVINRMLERIFRKGSLASVRLSTPAIAVIAEIAFWIIIFLAATSAARVAGLTFISGWLNQIVSHLPNLIVGAVIITFGYFASVYVSRLVAPRDGDKKAGERLLLGRLIQVFIFVTALIIGLDQVGIKVTFLVTLLTVAAGAILAGFAVAFGLGARDHVSNLIAARTAQNALHAGLKIRIGDIEGDILEVTPSHIALDTSAGRALVPARIIDEKMIEILTSTEEQANG